MLRYKKPVLWTVAVAVIILAVVAVCFLFRPERSVKDLLLPNTDWVCSEYEISFAVDEERAAEGTVLWRGEEKEISMGYRFAGRNAVIEFFSGDWEHAQAAGEEPFLSGIFTAQNGALVLKIEKNQLWTLTDTIRFVRPDTALSELKSQYPEFFGLNGVNGLDVIVWQMAEGSYDFGLLPHSDTPRDRISSELMDLPGVNAKQMRTILATYDLDEVDIYIVPWQNPLSSYITDPFCINEGESQEEKLESFVAFINALLFVDAPTE